jgi:hypothetical protein
MCFVIVSFASVGMRSNSNCELSRNKEKIANFESQNKKIVEETTEKKNVNLHPREPARTREQR